jgi:hypothetical protein
MEIQKAKFIGLLLLLAWPMLARAEDVSVCPSLEELDDQIINCDDGYFVSEKARECADKVLASWRLAADELKKKLESSGRTQNVSTVEAAKDYDKAMATLKVQILALQESTELVASYPDVMVDFPDAESDEDSLSCFSEPFQQVQETVTELDHEIIRAKKVYTEAKKMREVAKGRSQKLDAAVFAELGARAPAGHKSGKSTRSASDVTGLEEDEAKRSGVTEKVASKTFDSAEQEHGNVKSTVTSRVVQEKPLKDRSISEDSFAGRAGGEDALPGSFSSRLEERARARGVEETSYVAPKASASGGPSVGEALWQENYGAGAVRTKLELSGEVAGHLGKQAGALVETNGSNPVIRDTDLFTIVRLRYRSTELFQRASPMK